MLSEVWTEQIRTAPHQVTSDVIAMAKMCYKDWGWGWGWGWARCALITCRKDLVLSFDCKFQQSEGTPALGPRNLSPCPVDGLSAHLRYAR